MAVFRGDGPEGADELFAVDPARQLVITTYGLLPRDLDHLARAACPPRKIPEHDTTLRLSGTARGVDAARDRVGGDEIAQGGELWSQAKEHRHAFFAPQLPLWRLSLASTAAPLGIEGQWLYEWGGAQRWLLGHADVRAVRSLAQAHGGHATLYRGDPDREQVFHPLPAGLMNLHRRLKQAFDPHGIFNPGRMYREL